LGHRGFVVVLYDVMLRVYILVMGRLLVFTVYGTVVGLGGVYTVFRTVGLSAGFKWSPRFVWGLWCCESFVLVVVVGEWGLSLCVSVSLSLLI